MNVFSEGHKPPAHMDGNNLKVVARWREQYQDVWDKLESAARRVAADIASPDSLCGGSAVVVSSRRKGFAVRFMMSSMKLQTLESVKAAWAREGVRLAWVKPGDLRGMSEADLERQLREFAGGRRGKR